MPEISRFFGIIIRMYYDDHEPPHIHVEYSGDKVKIDFQGYQGKDQIQDCLASGESVD